MAADKKANEFDPNQMATFSKKVNMNGAPDPKNVFKNTTNSSDGSQKKNGGRN